MEQELVLEFTQHLRQSVYVVYGLLFLLFFILQPVSLKSIYGGVIDKNKRTPSYFLCLIAINLSIIITAILFIYFLLDIFVLYNKFIMQFLSSMIDFTNYQDLNRNYQNMVIFYLSTMLFPIIVNAFVLGGLMQLVYWHTNIVAHSLIALLYQLLNILIFYPLMIYTFYLLEFEVITRYFENSFLILTQ